jgi:small subunit ribosomal protein S15Ae
MVKMDIINDAFRKILNAEKIGKRQVLLRPSSKVLIKILSIMQRYFISPYKLIILK